MAHAPGRGVGGTPLWFADVLDEFKRRGCNLLVTGAVPQSVTARAAGRLLGSADEERRRVVVLTGSTTRDVEELLPDGVGLGDPAVRLVDRRVGARAVDVAAVTTADPTTPDDATALDELHLAVERALRSCDDGDPEPAFIRLCVASLAGPLDEFGVPSVRWFVDRTAAAVEGVRGMGHYHLPVPDEARVVGTLSPAFDARIELRRRSDLAAEHRWHVPGHEPTPWVRL